MSLTATLLLHSSEGTAHDCVSHRVYAMNLGNIDKSYDFDKCFSKVL